MKLNTRGRYAVMAVVDLALHGQGNLPVSLSDIATRQEISLSYLEQLFAQLRRGDVVKSIRGPGGGYVLAKPASSISVASVVEAVDESLQVTRCQGNAKPGCMGNSSRCLTHHLWQSLGDEIHSFLSRISIADVCDQQLEVEDHNEVVLMPLPNASASAQQVSL